MYVAIQEQEEMAMNPAKKSQIETRYKSQGQSGAWVGAFLFDKVAIEVSVVYFDYNNIFLAGNIV